MAKASLTAAQQLVIDQMKLGWMLHHNGSIKPPIRDEQSEHMRMVHRRVVMTLQERGLIEFTHSSDYWSLVKE